MSYEKQAETALITAVSNPNGVCLVADTSKRAVRMRHAIYEYRNNVKKKLAAAENVPYEDIVTEYDNFTVEIVEDPTRPEGEQWLIKITPIPVFKIIDPITGEKLG